VEPEPAHVQTRMQRLLRSLGFTEQAARYVTEDELINDADVLKDLDYDACERICKNARKHTVGGQCLTVADRAMNNFKMAVTVAKHFERTSRKLTPDDIDTTWFNAYKSQKDIEEIQAKTKHDLPTGLKLDDTPKAAKVFEAVNEHIGRYRGMSGAPLSYVIREHINMPDEPDPPFYAPLSRYVSFDAEMIRRAPIGLTDTVSENGPFHPTFLADMQKVWEILHDLFSTQPIWVHVKGQKFAKARNGRACYLAMHRHVLGQNNVHQQGQNIIDKLYATVYNGPTKNWTFDKYVSAHIDLHNQADALKEYGFNNLTGYVKVNAFTRNISDKAGFGPVAFSVLADNTLSDDFDRVKQLYVDYYRRHLLHAGGTTASSGPRAVSALKTGAPPGKKRKPDEPFKARVPTQVQLDSCKVQLKAYSDEEYSKLDWIARYKLRKMRLDKSNSERNNSSRGAKSTVSSLTQGVASTDGAGNQPSAASTRGSSGSNSTNPALVRPNVADRP